MQKIAYLDYGEIACLEKDHQTEREVDEKLYKELA